MSEPLLRIRDLTVQLRSDRGEVRAVDGVSIDVEANQRVGIIGESGSGKSVAALSVLQLHDPSRVRYGADSSIAFRGEELLRAPAERIRRVRGTEIAMVFQDPMAAINPVFTIGDQLGHVARSRLGLDRDAARARAIELLREVEIQAPERQLERYPHQLSGGMRQRVMIAMALLCNPDVLLADEPTSALDVTVQAAVLETMRRLTEQHETSTVLITHDMGVVARFCEVVHVMYGGRVVERGTVHDLFSRPRHPYTAALLRCTPRVDGDRSNRLATIRGVQETRLGAVSAVGCPFASRCDHAIDACRTVTPVLRSLDDNPSNAVACHRADELDLTKEIPSPDATLNSDA